MSQDEIKKEIKEINEKLDGMLRFLTTTDKKKNADICKAMKISRQTLFNWFDQGCPRESSTHCSLRDVKRWRAETVTKSK